MGDLHKLIKHSKTTGLRLLYFLPILCLLITFFIDPQGIYGQNNHKAPASYYELLSNNSFQKGNYDSAIFYQLIADSSLAFSIDLKAKLKSKLDLVKIFVKARDFTKAAEQLGHARHLLDTIPSGDKIALADFLQEKGNYYLGIGRSDSAFIFLNNSVQIRTSINGKEDTSLTYSLNKLGTCYYIKGKIDSANYYYVRALELSHLQTNPDNFESASYYQNAGFTYQMLGNYDKAETFLLKALAIMKSHLDSNDLALTPIYINLGRFYNSMDRFWESFSYYEKAKVIAQKHYGNDDYNLAPIYWNEGNYFQITGDIENSINYLLHSYYIYQKQYIPQRSQNTVCAPGYRPGL